jgi:hypothetical protein
MRRNDLKPFCIVMAIKWEKQEAKTPNELVFEQIRDIFTHYLKTNGPTSILPWKNTDMGAQPSIDNPKDLP